MNTLNKELKQKLVKFLMDANLSLLQIRWMPIELKRGSTTVKQGEKFNLTKEAYYYSTKKPQNRRGRWYYEFTHYSGTNYHLVGYSYIGGYLSFYPSTNLKNPSIYTDSNSANNRVNQLPFGVEDEHTVGVGIDTFKNRFYVYYKNNFEEFEFNKSIFCRELKALTWGSSADVTNDEVSINFGEYPFRYNISGFTPWENNQEVCSCHLRHPLRISVFVFSYIAVLC